MSVAPKRVLDAAAREGRHRYASWDQARFERLANGPTGMLWDQIAAHPHAEATLEAYATLLREAVGTGYFDGVEVGVGQTAPPNFLAFALLELVPQALGEEPPPDRVRHLATLWNLGEGLLSGPAWLDQYAMACAERLRRIANAEAFLIEALEPALAPATPAAWSGPFSVAVLDARSVLEDFLPGGMHLAAPRVVCIGDRHNPAHRLGILLGHGGQSRWLGPVPTMLPYVEDGPLPNAKVRVGKAYIGRHQVELPWLSEAHQVVSANAGFVVVSAVDSQRLWIVETQ